jgi:dTDP-4-dehydrorhamnose 3,5-epimerase
VIFTSTPLQGAYLIDLELKEDERGFCARTFCMTEFEEHGLETFTAQCNLSFNHRAGTLRGMHYQLPPAAEAKLVRCLGGAIYDVIIDLRKESPAFMQHFGVRLDDEKRTALYVPPLFGHGYQALTPGTEVSYQVSEFYAPGQERGLRYDDPAFGIEWPMEVTSISSKDASWPDFEREAIAS